MADVAKVLCFPRGLLPKRTGLLSQKETRRLLRRVDGQKTFVPRPEAERSDSLVQIIGCAVITDERGLHHALETPPTDAYESEGNLSLIVGGHTERAGPDDLTQSAERLARRAARREIAEELGRRPPGRLTPLGLLIDASSIGNSRHVGLLHTCRIDGPIYPDSSEFRADSPLSGRYTTEQLSKLLPLMDPWSRIYTLSIKEKQCSHRSNTT